jgi:hypothetical protein
MGSLAVLACRLLLEMEPSLEANRQTLAELVERRMAIAYSVPSHREYMRSGYPSEPLLAEAAARRMAKIRVRDHDETGRSDAIARKLLPHLRSGLVDKGERGELVARLLLMLTQDKAVEAQHARAKELSTAHGKVLYSTEVPVNDFMKTLFPHHWNEIKQSKPDNCDGETFENAFQDAVVRFTHFGRAADDYATSSAAACAAFMRGMAFQCRSGQYLIDIVIPILLWRSAKLGEKVMSGMLVSIKDRRVASTKAKVQVDESEIAFFPREENDEAPLRPYIALVLELGVQPPVPQLAKTNVKRKRAKQAQSQTPNKRPRTTPQADAPSSLSKVEVAVGGVRRSARNADTAPKVHPRYSIFAHGCSREVYGVVEDNDVYALLLASRDFLAEHPRNDAQSLDAVRRMKPFWTNGPQCYSWIDIPFLQESAQAPTKPVEGVSTKGPLVADDDVDADDDNDDNDNDDDDDDNDDDDDDDF